MRLGDRAKDKVTGFVGIAMTRQTHLTGCESWWLTSETETHEGKSVQRCFDILALEVVDVGAVVIPRPPEIPDAG